jgi:hypothetical protein
VTNTPDPQALRAPPGAAEPESGRTTLSILRAVQSGELSGQTLGAADRRKVVEHLWAEGYTVAETSEIVKVSERTILRDRSAIRQANAIEPDASLVPELVGGLLRQAEQTIGRLRRVSRDKATEAEARIDAELGCWRISRELIETLQTLGYLPSAPKVFQGELTHRVEEAPSYDELQAELDRVGSIVAAGGDTEVLDRVGQIKDTVNRLTLSAQLRALSSSSSSESSHPLPGAAHAEDQRFDQEGHL